MPVLRTTLWVMWPDSLLEAEAARKPAVNQRLTVSPAAFLVMKFLSRSSFIRRATFANASSQEIRFHSLEPGARYSGYLSRSGLWMKSTRPAPFGHRVPRFTGWSGSPSMWKMDDSAFFALSPRLYMIKPQLTEQYGQVFRVSVLLASLY